jgi:protein-tyrosine-phosphatase
MHTILFICTGNTCRSPLAEAIAQHWVDGGLLGDADRYLAASAGVAAANGADVSLETATALDRLGITFSGRSKPVTADMIRNAEVVFCMTEGHAAAARALVEDESEHVAKVHLLDPDGSIDDPLGMPQTAYDELSQRFMELIPRRLKEVFLHEDRARIGSPGS